MVTLARLHDRLPLKSRKAVISALLSAAVFVIAGHILISSFAATTYPTGDINHDGTVNILDLSILLKDWGTNIAADDLNHDGTVNIFDVSVLLRNWGQQATTATPTAIPTAALTGLTPMTVCSGGTTFCIGASPFYPYGASFYSSTAKSGLDSNPAGAIALAQKQHLNTVRSSNWLSHNDTVAQAENTSSTEWKNLDIFIADAQNANIRTFLDISDFKIILEKGCKNWVTDYADWDTFINLVAHHVNSVTGKSFANDPELVLVGFSGEPRETNKYYANDGGTKYTISGTSPALSTITESNWGTAVQSPGSSAGCGDPTNPANDFYYTSRDLTNYFAHVQTDWKAAAGNAILTLPGGLSKLDISRVRTDTISDSAASSTINDASITSNDAGSIIVGAHIPTGAYVGSVVPGASFTLVNTAGSAITPTGSDTQIDIRPNGGQDYRSIFANSHNDVCAFKTYGGAQAFLVTGVSYCINTLHKPSVNVEWGYVQGDGDSTRAQEFQGQFTNNKNAGLAGNFYWNAAYGNAPTTYDVDDGTIAPLTFNVIVKNAP